MRAHVGLVVLVVERVRLRHPHDVAGLDLRRVDQAEDAELALALLDSSSSGLFQVSSPSNTKNSSPRQVRPSFTRYGDHEPKFWMRPTLHLLGVHVDPVVREAVLLGHDERDGEEVAVAQVVGGVHAPSSAAGGSIACSSCEIGIDEMTWSHGYSVRAPSAVSAMTDDGPAVLVADADDPRVHDRPCSPWPRRGRGSAPTSSRGRTSGTGTPRSAT